MPHEELENVAILKKDENSHATLKEDENDHVIFDGEMSARNEPHDTADEAIAFKGPSGGVESAGEEKHGHVKPRSGDIGEALMSRHRVKLFSDGSLGAETAAMRVPYVGTDNNGILNHEPESLTRKVAQARDKGFRVEVHAIGDRALSSVLDAFEDAGITSADRPIVTHCQVAGPDLVKRMEALGVVAAVQPSFVPSDAAVVIKRLSPSVHASCYPWRTLLHAGVTCAGSSDAPIETHDPLRGIYDAVYRPNKPPPPPSEPQRSSPLAPETKSEAIAAHATTTTVVASTASFEVEDKATEHHREGIEGDKTAKRNSHGHGAEVVWDDVEGAGETERGVTPFLPDERLTLEEAVWMYTTGGAIAAGVEDRLGVIRPGCLADLTILEVEGGGAALLKDPSLIVEAKVSQVWVGGSCRWNNTGTDSPKEGMGVEEKTALYGSLSGSGFPGKNGPKRKRATDRGNPWLKAGSRRIGRCRCCT